MFFLSVSPDLTVSVLLLSHSEWRYCTHPCCTPWPPSGGGAADEIGSLSRSPEKREELTFTSIVNTVLATETSAEELHLL